MQQDSTLVFFIVMLALSAFPSSSVALVVSRSAMSGFAHGAMVACGIVIGDLLFVLLAILGMSALAETMGSLFVIVRYCCGAYLLYMGISLLRTRGAALPRDSAGNASLSASLLSGLLLTLSDIKAIFFYASLFPSFYDLSAMTMTDYFTVVTLTILTVGGVKLAYAYAAGKLLAASLPGAAGKPAQMICGGMLIGAGTVVILKS